MAGRGQEQICNQGGLSDARQAAPEAHSCDCDSEERGENERMREPAVSPKGTVADSESKSDDIKIGQRGTDRTGDPEAFRNTRPVETGSETESSHGM